MTTAAPDGVITAADLLFGSNEKAQEALTRHVMADGRAFARSLVHLPRVTREAAVREAAVAAAGLLKVDLIEVLVSGWREHHDVFSAARRTLDTPGSKELVGLAPHRISTMQQPAVGILLDGKRVHTLQLGLSILFEITGLVAGISHGRLAAVHAGRGHVGVALTIHEIEVLTKRTHLELPGHAGLRRGFRLLPASHYPDEPQSHPSGAHPGGQVPAAELMGAGFASAGDPLRPPAVAGDPLRPPAVAGHPASQPASAFPDVNLTDAAAEHPSAQPGPGHGSASWWEKTQAGPARHAAPGDPR